jgi:CheY-like chemotaxis protein
MPLPNAPSPTPRRILVVDDERLVGDSIRRVLQFDGHTAEIATNGAAALALLQESSFDLVVTDFEMPGMKGDKLAAAIKAIRPGLPVLLITAYGDQLRSAPLLHSTVDRILAKPFPVEDLRRAIAGLCVNAVPIAVALPPSKSAGRTASL